MFVRQVSHADFAKFQRLYDMYAPKLLGFITKYTDTKQQAEEYLEKVFLCACKDINSFDCNAEKKLLHIVLIVCKPVIKFKSNKFSGSYSTVI